MLTPDFKNGDAASSVVSCRVFRLGPANDLADWFNHEPLRSLDNYRPQNRIGSVDEKIPPIKYRNHVSITGESAQFQSIRRAPDFQGYK